MVRDACEGEVFRLVCLELRLETEGLGLLFVQSLNNVDVRGVVWGGDEQLWDWKAGGVWSSLKKKVEGCGSHSRWGFLEG